MALFTFVANYQKGVFVRQVFSEELPSACALWANDVVQYADFPGLNAVKFKNTFKEDISMFPPSNLDNTLNVWCLTIGEGRNFMLINIIKTEK